MNRPSPGRPRSPRCHRPGSGLRAFLLLAGLCVAPSITAQTPIDTLAPAERQAFELVSAGRHGLAGAALIQLLDGLTPGDAEGAARGQLWALRCGIEAQSDSLPGLGDRLEALAAQPAALASPALRDRLLTAALIVARYRGDIPGQTRLVRALGFLDTGFLLGPLPNERGANFGRTAVGELCADLDAAYAGARRPVRWRRLPRAGTAPTSVLELDDMLRPAEQVLALVAFVLDSDAERDAVLHLGSSESAAVWLNGEQLWSRDVRRGFRPDQDQVLLPLRRGPNLLVLEAGSQGDEFRIAARLRGGDGLELDRDQVALRTEADAFRTAAAMVARPLPSDAAPPPRAEEVWTPRDDAAAAFYLAQQLTAVSSTDRNDDQVRDLARRAAAAWPDFAPAGLLYADSMQRDGSAEEIDVNGMRAQFLAMLERHADRASLHMALAQLTWRSTRALEAVENHLDRALELDPDLVEARRLRAEILGEQGAAAAAERALRRALGAPRADGTPRNHRSLEALARNLARYGATHRTEALAICEEALRAADEPRLNLLRAELLARSGRFDEAVDTLRGAIARHPFERGLYVALETLTSTAGDARTALAAATDWLTICPEDDDMLVRIADLHGEAGETEARIEALRAAVELDPNRERELRLLEFLEADSEPFFTPFVIDADAVLAADQGPPADAAEANDSHHVLLRQDVVSAFRNGTTSTYRHRILRILNERGAELFNVWFARHNRGDQRARILGLRVIDRQGEVRRPRLLGSVAQLPPLSPGDVIDVRERVDDLEPSFFGDYFGLEHRFDDDAGVPTARSELVLLLEDGRDYRFQRRAGVPEPVVERDVDGFELRRYAMRNVPRRHTEERAPDADETQPLLRVTTYESWDAFASWWWNLIRRQTEVSPEMRAKVAELTAGLDDEMAKIAAIYGFVTTDVRYEAWEFGVHGYQPYATSVVFERRHGDCKDKALLLNALLAEAGIEAFPVLIHADAPRSTDDLSLAMVQHFNHCISYLPRSGDRPGMFLDGTAIWHPTDTLPAMDQGAEVLVVRGSDAELKAVPVTTPDQNVAARSYICRLEADGSGSFVATLQPLGNAAVGWREFLANEPARREEQLERVFAREFGEVSLDIVEASAPQDLDQPVEFTVRGRGGRLADVTGDGLLTLRPTPSPATLLRFATAETRELPLLLPLPEGAPHEVVYELPAGLVPTGPLPEPVRIDTALGSYQQAWIYQEGRLTVRRELRLPSRRIEPQEYPQFRAFAEQVDAAERRTVTLKTVKKEGSR